MNKKHLSILLLSILVLITFVFKFLHDDTKQIQSNDTLNEHPHHDEPQDVSSNTITTASYPNANLQQSTVLSQSETNLHDLDKQILQLTLEEKIGQMLFAGISDSTLTESDTKLIEQYKVGGLIFFKNNLHSPNQITTLLNDIKTMNRINKYPLFLGIDQEGGRISRLPKEITSIPSNFKIAKTNNVSFAYDIGTILGKELSAFGFNLNFAPVLDVNSNPNNPVIGDRSFSDNPKIVSTFGIETMNGLHSQNIISVIKHFPGHGDTDVDSHFALPTIAKTKEQLNELELMPFNAAIATKADMIMIAHILLPKIDTLYPASMSKPIITDLLREEMQFDGVVITDDLTMKAITNHYSIEEAAIQSVQAGADLLLIAHETNNVELTFQALINAVENGELSEERINQSVKRIIKLKEKYHLNNTKLDEVNVEELNQTINNILNKYQS